MRATAVTELRHDRSSVVPSRVDDIEQRQRSDSLLFTVEEAADQLLIGRSLMYELIKSGQIATIRIGRLRRVPREAVTEFISRLEATQPGA